MVDLTLAGEFPPATRDQWLARVEEVLAKSRASFDSLVSSTDDGFTIQPLYDTLVADPGLPGQAPYVRGRRAVARGWDVCARVTPGSGPAVAELEGGATSLWLDPVDPAVLDGVLLDLVTIRAAGDPAPLLALYAAQGVDPAGRLAVSLPHEAVPAFARAHPGVRCVLADGTSFEGDGASDAQELGYTLAAGVAALRRLSELGLEPAAAWPLLEVRHAATAEQFATIAKLRAGRRLWARVAEVLGVDAPPPPQHAVTSEAMLSAYDPWVNLLRTTVAAFAAGVGGADAVTVLPYDRFSAPTPGELGRRLARNIQALLLEESHLGEVTDLAGGSWYVESLTHELADAGWAAFQEVEAAGGIDAAGDLVRSRIDATWAAKVERLARGDDAVTGVSEFPNVAEPPPVAVTSSLRRRAAAFEELRARTDRHVAAGNPRPTVRLHTLGSPSAYTARATYAANLFGLAGIETTDGPSPLLCICSSDKVYADQAAEAARSLQGAGRVYLAGRPIDGVDVDEFVHVGIDRLEVLGRALDSAGVGA